MHITHVVILVVLCLKKSLSLLLGDYTMVFQRVAHYNKVVIYLRNNYSYLKN